MKGTEKQIKYAMDILAKAKATAEEEIAFTEKLISQREAKGGDASRHIRAKEQKMFVMSAIDLIAESDIKAGAVINDLNSYNRIWDWIDAFDNDVDHLIASKS
ncbi:MAG: hypothetical protein ACI4WX_02965 [Aristaeellaceae bacterium]